MDIETVGPKSGVVRDLRQLALAKHRQARGLLLVEGGTVLREALRAGLAVERVIVRSDVLAGGGLADLLDELARAGVTRVYAARDEVLARLSTMNTPHDLVAAVRAPHPRGGSARNWVALDGVQDPGNVGAILRSALAFGCDGAWLGEGTADAWHPKVLRSSAGAVFHLAAAERVVLPQRLQAAEREGFRILGLDPRRGRDPRGLTSGDRLVVVLGSEGRGLSPAAAAAVHEWVTIPLDPRVESLNVAAAAAIVLYELARSTLCKRPEPSA